MPTLCTWHKISSTQLFPQKKFPRETKVGKKKKKKKQTFSIIEPQGSSTPASTPSYTAPRCTPRQPTRRARPAHRTRQDPAASHQHQPKASRKLPCSRGGGHRPSHRIPYPGLGRSCAGWWGRPRSPCLQGPWMVVAVGGEHKKLAKKRFFITGQARNGGCSFG